MIAFIIGFLIGAFVGWNVSQPAWAKEVQTKISEWLNGK